MPADADPAFDVATVKPSRPDAMGRGPRVQGANISTLNMTLMDLVTFAYDVHVHRSLGCRHGQRSSRYDITGKAARKASPTRTS